MPAEKKRSSAQVNAEAEGLAQRLRALRGEESQEAFSAKLGISRAALANYELGRTRPKPSIITAMSRRLGVSDDFLVNGGVRNEWEWNRLLGGPLDWRTHETEDELAFVRVLRASSPTIVARVAWLLLKELEDNEAARSSADQLRIRDDITRLGRILEAGGKFERGQSPEEADAEIKELARRGRANREWLEANWPGMLGEHSATSPD